MTTLDRVRCVWTGFTGAPGVSTFYFNSGGTPPLSALRTFFSSLAPNLPDDVTVTVQNTGDKIDDTTGKISGSWSGSAQTPVVGSDTQAYSAPSGAVIRWNTDLVQNGRHVRGHTFIVPISGPSTSTTGQLLAAARTGIQACADNLVAAAGGVAAPHWMIYSQRYRVSGIVTSATVGSKLAVLRSRRD